MKKGRTSKSALFLTELIISVFFLIAACAVCVQLFAGAQIRNNEAEDGTRETSLLQNAAESFYAAQGDPEKTLEAFQEICPGLEIQDGTGTAHFDSDWNGTDVEDAVHILTLSFSSEKEEAGVMHHLLLSITDASGEEELSRTVDCYESLGVNEEGTDG